ncbi:stage III sporulation protein AF [Brevibacillus ginsengisoli]|uniref:stage III sporulation protein AF n=1 Tax=Brevibacillus ginsengisoli TaxID=363854 RepID=UPI003CF72AF9
MELLTLWLKKIILLVLLAAFLDLILPNTNMQRYVKMVMGLIILIMILSPLFSFLHLSQEDLAIQLNRYQQEIVGKSPQSDWKSMAQKLAGEKDTQVSSYVTTQLATLIKRDVENHYQVAVSDVRIQMSNTSTDQPQIKSVSIDIDQTKPPQTRQIASIKPIQVRIGDQKGSKQEEALPVSGTQEDPLSRQIAASVAKNWDLQENQVYISKTNKLNENRQ